MSSRSLRTTSTAVTALTAALALVIAGALMLLTTQMRRLSAAVGAAVESISLADEMEIALLMHERSTDAVLRGRFEADLLRKLADARRYVTTDEEAALLREAAARIDEYFADRKRIEAAYRALDAFVALNVEQSKDAQRQAAAWDGLADTMGISMGAVIVAVVVAFLWWMRRRVFRPVLALSRTMARYGGGERSLRAEEDGASELVEMQRRFNEMAAALEERREAQIAFLGRVAHDLRNPLSLLKMQAAMLPPERPLPDEPRIRRLVDMVRRQVERLDRMIGDLLDSARIDAGHLELKLDEHDVRPLVRETCALFDGVSETHRLELSLPERELRVRCDPLRVEQVVGNLISNAMKYSMEGTVRVALEARDSEAVIRVSDEGIGIAPADREQLFEPFRRLGISRDRAPGVGLGLFGVRKIVEAHGGRIELDSELGRGSTFRVHLPVSGPVSGPA